MRFLAFLLLFLVATTDAAKPRKKGRKAAGKARHKVERVVREKPRHAREAVVARVVAPAIHTGNPELDLLLRDRPAPEAWTDSVLSIPAAPIATAAASGQVPWRGDTPVERLRSIAEPWIGTPYRTGGNGENGFDCSGFVNRVLLTFGVHLAGRSSPSFWTQGETVDTDDLRPGDLVFFSDGSRRIGHVGLYLENGNFIHASVAKGIMISALEEKYYRRRFKGARRIPALVEILSNGSGRMASGGFAPLDGAN